MLKDTGLTREDATALRAEAVEALQEVAKRHGLVLEASNGRFGELKLSLDVEFKVVKDDGTSPETQQFERMCGRWGLQKSDLGRELSISGRRVAITGASRRTPKYPVICVDLDAMKVVRYTAESVRQAVRNADRSLGGGR